jgi:hypothetical protein
VSVGPKALTLKSTDDMLAIEYLLCGKDLQGTLGMIVTAYEALSKADGVNYFLKTDSSGRTLLNALIDSYATGSNVIKQVLLACPEAAAIKKDDGESPLLNLMDTFHHHQKNDGDEESLADEVFELVLDAHHTVAMELVDSEKVFPLHVAARSNSLAVVKMVYDAFPGAIAFSADYGCGRPLHQAAEYGNHYVIEFLHSQDPDAILSADETSNELPLHFAAKSH